MTRFYFFIISFFLFACTSNTQNSNQEEKTNNSVLYAKHFHFFNDENNQLRLAIINPDTKEQMAVLSPLEYNKNIVALSSTFIGMMDKLELEDFIVGVSDIQYVYSEKVLKNFKAQKVIEAGYDTQLNLEKIIASKPSMILHSGFGQTFPHQKQLENLQIQCIPIYDWREESPLGKAEWIKVYGFLYGKSQKADSIFYEIEKEYNKLKNTAKDFPPSKLIMSGNIMGSEWYCPAGDSYFAQMMKDANITYHYYDTKGTGSIALTQEKILLDNKNAAIWINPGAKNLNELKQINPKSIYFDAFKNGTVYCRSHNENKYWETSTVEPDKLLSDLIQIAHQSPSKQHLFFYSRLLEK